MIRGGKMDIVVMGALQANDKGDYAGWANPSRGLDVVISAVRWTCAREPTSFF